MQKQTCTLVLVGDLQAGLAGTDIYLSVYLKEFWFKFFSLNLFYLFCVHVLFYFILKVNQYWPNSLNHVFSTGNEVSVQVHEGPEENGGLRPELYPPSCVFFFFFLIREVCPWRF